MIFTYKNSTITALLLWGTVSAMAQQKSPAETVSSWEVALNKQDFRAAYNLSNTDSIGTFNEYMDVFGSITSVSFMDMAAPTSDTKNRMETVSAGGAYTDTKMGDVKGEFTFTLMNNQQKNNWEITNIVIHNESINGQQLEEANEPVGTEMREEVTDTAEAADDAVRSRADSMAAPKAE